MTKAHNIAYMIRARIMQQITEIHYKKGCQNPSLWVVWINHIFPAVGVDYETYLNGLSVDVSDLDEKIKVRQALEWEKHRRKLADARRQRTQKQQSEKKSNAVMEMEELL